MKFTVAMAVVLVVIFPLVLLSANKHTQNNSGHCEIMNGPVAEYIADTKAGIGWTTNAKAHMALMYGTDAAHLDRVADAIEKEHGRNHHASLSGLKPNTRYFFQVTLDSAAVSDVGTFTTLQVGSAATISKAIQP